MHHPDFYVLAGTAFPILLLAMFAADTTVLSRDRGRWRARASILIAVCLPIVGLAACMYALQFDYDPVHLRTVINALLLGTVLVIVNLAVDHQDEQVKKGRIEAVRQGLTYLLREQQAAVTVAEDFFIVITTYDLSGFDKKPGDEMAGSVGMTVAW